MLPYNGQIRCERAFKATCRTVTYGGASAGTLSTWSRMHYPLLYAVFIVVISNCIV